MRSCAGNGALLGRTSAADADDTHPAGRPRLFGDIDPAGAARIGQDRIGR
jgi:hypothetical protein